MFRDEFSFVALKDETLSVLGNITLRHGVGTNTIASNFLGYKKKSFRYQMFRGFTSGQHLVSGLFGKGSFDIVKKKAFWEVGERKVLFSHALPGLPELFSVLI